MWLHWDKMQVTRLQLGTKMQVTRLQLGTKMQVTRLQLGTMQVTRLLFFNENQVGQPDLLTFLNEGSGGTSLIFYPFPLGDTPFRCSSFHPYLGYFLGSNSKLTLILGFFGCIAQNGVV
jgi:hypothetical protein